MAALSEWVKCIEEFPTGINKVYIYFICLSPDLDPKERVWDVGEQKISNLKALPTDLQHLCSAIMSMWIRISEEWLKAL